MARKLDDLLITGGTPQLLSRFIAKTTANTTAQALSTAYADILEIADTDVIENVGGFILRDGREHHDDNHSSRWSF